VGPASFNAGCGCDICDRARVGLVRCSNGSGVNRPVQAIIIAQRFVHVGNCVSRTPAVATDFGVAAVKTVCRESRAMIFITGGINGASHGVSGPRPCHGNEGPNRRASWEVTASAPVLIDPEVQRGFSLGLSAHRIFGILRHGLDVAGFLLDRNDRGTNTFVFTGWNILSSGFHSSLLQFRVQGRRDLEATTIKHPLTGIYVRPKRWISPDQALNVVAEILET